MSKHIRVNLGNNKNREAANDEGVSCLDGHTYYAVTIKPSCNDKVYYETDLMAIYRGIIVKARDGNNHKVVYEMDSKYKLHLHGLMSARHIFYKNVHKYGWHIHIAPLETIEAKERWENYLVKEVKNEFEQEQLLLRHLCQTDNLFVNFMD